MKHEMLNKEIMLVADDTLDLIVVGAGHSRKKYSNRSRSRNSSKISKLSNFLSFNKISLVLVVPVNLVGSFNINFGGSNVTQTSTANGTQTNVIGIST